MISFRYHVVSLVAAFLALAIGVVVGTTALKGPVTSDLRHQVDHLTAQRSSLSGQVHRLQGQMQAAGQFATTFGSKLVAGSLQNEKVLVVSLPGAAQATADGVAEQLTAAGADITGRLQLAPEFVAAGNADSISTLATQSHPLGLTLPTTSDARALGASLLSFVLVGKGKDTDLSSVLSGLAGLHMITSAPDGISAAKDVVVVGGGSLATQPYAAQADRDLVTDLVADGGTVVVAGDRASASKNGIIALTRAGSGKSTVSTVDNADTAFGQVSTALALAAALHSQVGQYGTAQGAQALFPALPS